MTSDSEPPVCQFCGKECGNEGAKSNHEQACPENPANKPQQQQSASQQPVRDSQQAEPAQPHNSTSAGATLAETFIAATDDDLPTGRRAQTLRKGLEIVGDAIDRYTLYRQQKQEQQRQRATNIELEEATEHPTCKCGYQFDGDDIGVTDSHVRCPECEALYEIRDETEQ